MLHNSPLVESGASEQGRLRTHTAVSPREWTTLIHNQYRKCKYPAWANVITTFLSAVNVDHTITNCTNIACHKVFIGSVLLLSSWLLYEKPGFQGRVVALEEGPTELANEWAEPEPDQEVGPDEIPVPTKPMVIGSIRLAVRVRADRSGFSTRVCRRMLTTLEWWTRRTVACRYGAFSLRRKWNRGTKERGFKKKKKCFVGFIWSYKSRWPE